MVLVLSAAAAMCSTAYAAQLGHARIVSQQNQPLRVAVPVTQLTRQDIQSFAVSAAPLADWKQAGLVPPVDPATLQFQLVDGARASAKTIQVSSSQPFNGPVADLLLNVQTASGRQQYQVSILAPVQTGAAAQAPGSSSSQGPGQAAGSAVASPGAQVQTIRVRRGDTLFSIARRHAVPQASVYQMMIALQRANPQAFINGNVNLVKAGATLQMPGMAELTAVSDREARRIFQRHAQEFEQYRQGVAGRQGQAVTGGAATKGGVSEAGAGSAADQNSARAQDKLVLSSGSSPDKTDDERTAAGKNLAESQERVSQLEQNVKNLNQALQAQGQAAKDAVVDGATGLGQTLTDAASSLTDNSGTTAGTAAADTAAAATGPAAAGSSPASSSASASGSSAPPAAAQPGQAGGPTASGAASPSQAGGNGAAGASDSSTNNTVNNASNKAGQSVSWFQEHLLGVVTALLALAVLIIAWVLRRANAARDDDDPASPVTEAMVQEQLDKINLDLREPPVTETK